MKIVYIDEIKICFDNGSILTYDHEIEDCEHSYADFTRIGPDALEIEFKEPLIFKAVDGSGFTFGDLQRKVFVPCISEQDGKYTDDLDILLNGNNVLTVGCQIEPTHFFTMTKIGEI